MRSRYSNILLLTSFLAAWPLERVTALDPVVTKLYRKDLVTFQFSPEFGQSVAISEKWILVGEPGGNNTGLAYVYSAVTGSYVRTLQAPAPVSGARFGASVVVSGNLALVGASNPTGFGSAYVFDLLTGKVLQTLVSNEGQAGAQFGFSVALSGTRAVVGAPGFDTIAITTRLNTGRAFVFEDVHVFDPVPRAQTRRLTPSDNTESNEFGTSVALSGVIALVGVINGDGISTDTGAAYVFDTSKDSPSFAGNAVQLYMLAAIDGLLGDQFGASVALSGRLAMVGAPRADGIDVNAGAAYVFDLTTGEPVVFAPPPAVAGKIMATDGEGGDLFGNSLAFSGTLALIGASADNHGTNNAQGTAYLFDTVTGQQLRKLVPSDGDGGDLFGTSVALCANRAVIGVVSDDDLGVGWGSAYFMRPVAGPFPMASMAVLKSFAPRVPETVFANMGDAVIDDNGNIMFPGTLVGAGAAGGRNRGLWDSLDANGGLDEFPPLDLTLLSGVELSNPAGLKPTGFFRPIINQPDEGLFEVTVAGAGVTTANNRLLMRHNGSLLGVMLRTGVSAPLGGGEVVSRFVQVVQPMFVGQETVAFQLKLGSGVTPVTAASDSGIVVLGGSAATVAAAREGLAPNVPMPSPANYGQFTRVSHQHEDPVYTVGLQGLAATTANNQGLFHIDMSSPFLYQYLIARKDDESRDEGGNPVSGAKYGAFTGETMSFAEEMVFRATLKLNGAVVTSSNDQGLWWVHSAALRLAAREGAQVQGLPAGVVWSSFLSFWGMDVLGAVPDPVVRGQVLFLARLRGPGVTTANDTALCVLEEDVASPPVGTPLNPVRILMREGDLASDCDGARIGVIQRVVASPYYAQYAVLVSLTNAPATSNQALYRGSTVILPRTHLGVLRKPFLALRKGTLYEGASSYTTLQSISLPATSLDATGAGGKGLGLPINRYGEVVLKVTFTDGAVHMVKGAP